MRVDITAPKADLAFILRLRCKIQTVAAHIGCRLRQCGQIHLRLQRHQLRTFNAIDIRKHPHPLQTGLTMVFGFRRRRGSAATQ